MQLHNKGDIMTKSGSYITKVAVALTVVLAIFVGIAAVLAVLGAVQWNYVLDWSSKLAAVALIIFLTNVVVACLIDLSRFIKNSSHKK